MGRTEVRHWGPHGDGHSSTPQRDGDEDRDAAEAPALCLGSPAAGVAGDKGTETWQGTRGQKQPGAGRVAGVGEGLPRPRAAAPRCTWSKVPQPGARLR